MSYLTQFNRWLSKEDLAADLKAELLTIKDDDDAIKMRFIKNMEFGTGGLRATMSAGTNAMNIYTVAQASQGLANVIIHNNGQKKGIVIGRDSRNNSEVFARAAAEVFAANGIKTYFFDALRPTPVLSFAIRELGCIAGVNITASHNPSEYNGYKAYWEDGAQLSLEDAEMVSSYINTIDIFDEVKRVDFDKAVENGDIIIVGAAIDDKFIENVTSQLIDPDAIKSVADDLKIVYTPLHGTGYRLIPEVLRLCGVKHLYPVWQQMILDGNFPTVAFPNPEFPESLALGAKLADEVGSDLVIATDPDADRCGIMVRNKENKFVTVTGNQAGALLLDYILTAYEQTGTMPTDPYAVKTIVTTELATKICKEHGVELFNVLTGFKFIGEVIKKKDDMGLGHYLFGFEESYGYLKGTYARDKDAVVAAMLITEMAAYYKKRGMTLYDALVELFDKYGYYKEHTVNATYKGLDGTEQMRAMMENIRNNPPKAIAGREVLEIRDYQYETVLDVKTGEKSPTGLPVSNVLYFRTEGDNVVVIRPSGTEPKIKLYLLVNGACEKCANKTLEEFKVAVEDWTK